MVCIRNRDARCPSRAAVEAARAAKVLWSPTRSRHRLDASPLHRSLVPSQRTTAPACPDERCGSHAPVSGPVVADDTPIPRATKKRKGPMTTERYTTAAKCAGIQYYRLGPTAEPEQSGSVRRPVTAFLLPLPAVRRTHRGPRRQPGPPRRA